MLSGIYRNPTAVYFGAGALDMASQELSSLGSSALLIFGGFSGSTTKIVEDVKNLLERGGVTVYPLGGVRANPTSDFVYRAAAVCRQNNVNFVVAVGGGSVIDTAKAVAIASPDGGDFFDFFKRTRLPTSSLPVAAILTISGSGSESSDGAVIDKNREKYSCGSPLMYPKIAVLDPGYTITVPRYLTSCGIADSISHILERYFSTTPHVEVSTGLCESLMRSIMHLGPRVLGEPSNANIRAELMWASKVAHDNTVGFGRKHDWATHTIVHELGARFDRPHGELLAIVFPAWMSFMAGRNPSVFQRLGSAVFRLEDPSPESAIECYKDFLRDIELPTRLRDVIGAGVSDQFQEIADACSRTTQSGTLGNFQRISSADTIEILKLAL